ncbi:GNAT family N-acetyltransferase [Paracoccus sp. KR1-242]|uniref:GNAT family N-acetyltransferase n=1 Tax=Paracoccus sp. KR1-242 TaxID=3410028 RepID=UPI003BFE999F
MTDPIIYVEDPSDEDRQAILEQLIKSNLHRGPSPDLHRFAFELKSACGTTIGGLMGRTAYDWAVIELLYIPDSMRGTGIGRRLVGKAEELARNRRCIGIWLDTFSFQAPGFYQQLGYEVFGELSDNPVGQSRYFLRKLLT